MLNYIVLGCMVVAVLVLCAVGICMLRDIWRGPQ